MEKVDRFIIIPYDTVIFGEAVYLMEHHDGDCWCDCDKKAIVMVE